MKKKTKKDSLATKKDLNKLASKVDFKNLRKEVLKIEARVENLEDGQGRIETKLDIIENKLDGFVGTVDNLKKDNEIGTDQYREHDLKITDHESRLTTLESQ